MRKIKKAALAASMLTMAYMPAIAGDTPQFKGGESALEAYISTNMKYPASAKANGVEGVVQLQFTVKADGSIGPIKVVRLIDPDLEAEAIRLVKSMPAWIPADKGGVAVDATVTLPVKFTLE